jgi:hypothetical protein
MSRELTARPRLAARLDWLAQQSYILADEAEVLGELEAGDATMYREQAADLNRRAFAVRLQDAFAVRLTAPVRRLPRRTRRLVSRRVGASSRRAPPGRPRPSGDDDPPSVDVAPRRAVAA